MKLPAVIPTLRYLPGIPTGPGVSVETYMPYALISDANDKLNGRRPWWKWPGFGTDVGHDHHITWIQSHVGRDCV
jgi:hypothetical protein